MSAGRLDGRPVAVVRTADRCRGLARRRRRKNLLPPSFGTLLTRMPLLWISADSDAGAVGQLLHARVVHVETAVLAAAAQVVHAQPVDRDREVRCRRAVAGEVELAEDERRHRRSGNQQRARHGVLRIGRGNRVENLAVGDEGRLRVDDVHGSAILR